MERPYTTLFLLTSVDGKISTGDTPVMDVDTDYPQIPGVKEGLHQYYDLEKETDLFTWNTGSNFAKIGFNEKTETPKTPLNFVVVDNKPHLNEKGVSYLANRGAKLIVITTNKSHPAFALKSTFPNIEVLAYENLIDFKDVFRRLKADFGAERITIQSGGTLNTTLVREGLIDRVLLVVAPALSGGKDTPTLMDGESLHSTQELSRIKALELVQAKPLENSYVLLEYKVRN